LAFFKKSYFASIIIFLAALIIVLALVSFGRHGAIKLYKMKKEKEEYLTIIKDLNEKNRLLAAEIRRLKEDPEYFESVVRKELGMVRDNEMIYHFKKDFKGHEDNTDKNLEGVENGSAR
jgi:cell division protein FtsB